MGMIIRIILAKGTMSKPVIVVHFSRKVIRRSFPDGRTFYTEVVENSIISVSPEESIGKIW
jgi:hypothetical protein